MLSRQLDRRAYHSGHIEQCSESSVRPLILRHSLNTSLLDVKATGYALDLGVETIANFEALSWYSAIVVSHAGSFLLVAAALAAGIEGPSGDTSILLDVEFVVVGHGGQISATFKV